MILNTMKNLISGKQKNFQKLCHANHLNIDYKTNITEFTLLKA